MLDTPQFHCCWLEVERRGDMHDSGLVKVGDCCSCMEVLGLDPDVLERGYVLVDSSSFVSVRFM